MTRKQIHKMYNVAPTLIHKEDCQTFVSRLEQAIPRQNGTPSQVEALRKSLERGKKL